MDDDITQLTQHLENLDSSLQDNVNESSSTLESSTNSEDNENKEQIENEVTVEDHFLSLISSLMKFHDYMVEDGLLWTDEYEKEQWLLDTENAVSTEQLAHQMEIFIEKVNPKYWFGTWKQKSEAVLQSLRDVQTIANQCAQLKSIEVSISWNGVVEKFKVDRSGWVGELSGDIPAVPFVRARGKSARK